MVLLRQPDPWNTGGMYRVEIYGRVRRAVLVEGRSQRAVAREFGISRDMVRKMLRYAVPPGYQRQQAVKRPRLGPWLGVIDAILEDDKRRPAKQRHTAKRIFDRLRDEHGFRGGYGIVSQYVRGERLRGREMFVPLVHPAGEAQADFGEALVVVAGVEAKFQESGQLRLPGHPIVEQGDGAGTGALGVYCPSRKCAAVRQQRHREDAHRTGSRPGRLPEGLSRALHHGGGHGA